MVRFRYWSGVKFTAILYSWSLTSRPQAIGHWSGSTPLNNWGWPKVFSHYPFEKPVTGLSAVLYWELSRARYFEQIMWCRPRDKILGVWTLLVDGLEPDQWCKRSSGLDLRWIFQSWSVDQISGLSHVSPSGAGTTLVLLDAPTNCVRVDMRSSPHNPAKEKSATVAQVLDVEPVKKLSFFWKSLAFSQVWQLCQVLDKMWKKLSFLQKA